MPSARDTDVLVLGAGPVGLMAAIHLSERGLGVRIVDKYSRTALRSYALALHSRSLRLMDELGLAETLLSHGHRLEQLDLHHDGQTTQIDLTRVGQSHPYVLVLPQYLLEGALERRLNDNGVQVEWNRQVLTFDAGADGVRTLLTPTPEVESQQDGSSDLETQRIRSTFLVGADGGDSLTRRLLDIDSATEGLTSIGLLEFERRIDAPSRLQMTLGPETTDVMWPLAADRGRWTVEYDGPSTGEELARIKRIVGQRSPWFGDDFGTVEWVTSLNFERRLAERCGRGAVWLVGDAAHFTSPIGVQSMNIGFREAYDLARRIADILLDGGSPLLLDYFNEERQREWKMMLGIKDRLCSDGATPAWDRATAARLVRSLPASGRDLNLLLQQLGFRLNWKRGRARR